MSRNLSLALTLTARDTGSKVLRKAMQDAIQQTKAAEKHSESLSKTQQQSATKGIQASKTLSAEYQRATSARSTLGIRSEREIQREIALTQAAYSRLTRSGLMSTNEQSRAFTTMAQRVGRLRDELKGAGNDMSRMGRMERARGLGSNAMALAGGVTAAAMVIKDPVQRQMAFERRNAEIANTAFNQLPADERIKKIPLINTAIRGAVRHGGGTPEAAQETLNTLFAGGLDDETAMKILPDITRYATASGANPDDLAKIGIAAIKNFGIKLSDLPKVFDKSIRSGENGKYELSDMAISLPLTLSKANAIGMSGLDDLDTLLAMLQANAETAGDNSAASTNVNGLLDKYTSADTQNVLKNRKFRNKSGKIFNYTDYMTDQRMQGVSVPAAFTNVVSGIVSSDKRVKHLRAEAEKYKGTDKENDIKAALDVAIASVISKIVADREAGMALKTSILKEDFIKEQVAGTQNAVGAGAASFSVVSSTNDFKSQQFESEKLFAEQNAMKPVADLYGNLTVKLTDYAKEYPELTTAVSGATTAIKAMTTAAVAFAGIKFFTGGGKSGGGMGIPGIPKGLGGAIPTGGAIPVYVTNWQDGNKKDGNDWLDILSKVPGSIGKWASYAQVASELYDKVDSKKKELEVKGITIGDHLVQEMQKEQKPLFDIDIPGMISSWWSPPTTIGAGPGGVASFGSPSYLTPSVNQKPQPIQVTTKLVVDERVLAETVNEYNNGQAGRGPTGGGN